MGFFSFGPTNNITFGNDLSGTDSGQTAIRLQNIPIDASVPTVGDIWKYTSTEVGWIHTAEATGTPTGLSGDVTNSSDDNVVIRLQNHMVRPGTPLEGDTFKYAVDIDQWNHAPQTTVTSPSLAGDVHSTGGATTIEKIQGVTIQTGTPSSGDFLQCINSDWKHQEFPPLGNNLYGNYSGYVSTGYVGVIVYCPTNNSLYLFGQYGFQRFDLTTKVTSNVGVGDDTLYVYRMVYCPVDDCIYYTSRYSSVVHFSKLSCSTGVNTVINNESALDIMYSPSTQCIYYFKYGSPTVLRVYNPITLSFGTNVSTPWSWAPWLGTTMNLTGTQIAVKDSNLVRYYSLDFTSQGTTTVTGGNVTMRCYSAGPCYLVSISTILFIINQSTGALINTLSTPWITNLIIGAVYDSRTGLMYISLDAVAGSRYFVLAVSSVTGQIVNIISTPMIRSGVAGGNYTSVGGYAATLDAMFTMGYDVTQSNSIYLYSFRNIGPWHVGGDLLGTTETASVVKFAGHPINMLAPTTSDTWLYFENGWEHSCVTPSTTVVTMGGDVSGLSSDCTVIKINSYPISTMTPTLGDLVRYNGSEWSYVKATVHSCENAYMTYDCKNAINYQITTTFTSELKYLTDTPYLARIDLHGQFTNQVSLKGIEGYSVLCELKDQTGSVISSSVAKSKVSTLNSYGYEAEVMRSMMVEPSYSLVVLCALLSNVSALYCHVTGTITINSALFQNVDQCIDVAILNWELIYI